jgi:hypothetical protein
MLIGSIVLGTHQVEAQAYGPYYTSSWYEAQYQGYAQEYDPYYELHVLHYQLYLPQYQYQPYPIYPSCCFAGGVVVPSWSTPIIPPPKVIISPRPQAMRRR